MTLTYNNITVLTRLIQFVLIAMLVFIGLTTTGCGFVDSNDPDEIAIERVLRQEPGATESIAGQTSTDGQTAGNDGLNNDPDLDPYGNPVKDGR